MGRPAPPRTPRQDGTTSTELVLLMPVVLLLVMLVVQLALWQHAGQVADATVEEALVATQVAGGSVDAGTARAYEFAAAAGGLRNVAVEVRRTLDAATVFMTAAAPVVVPGLTIAIEATATGPVERFRPAGGVP